MTWSPFLNFSIFKQSHILSFSIVFKVSKRAIFERNVLYCSLLFITASFTIRLKVCRSKLHSTQSLSALMLAALGALYKSASSPKAEPLSYLTKKTSFPSIFLEHSNSPDSTIYKSSPSSPYLIINLFLSILTSCIAKTHIFFSDASRWAKMKDFSMIC